jgi:hypothetical protein
MGIKKPRADGCGIPLFVSVASRLHTRKHMSTKKSFYFFTRFATRFKIKYPSKSCSASLILYPGQNKRLVTVATSIFNLKIFPPGRLRL